MSLTAREYLIDRFRTDAQVLRERADGLARGGKLPGPDLATSRRMADACAEVAAMIDAVATPADALAAVHALAALIPLLEQRAGQQQAPAVRAVYAGAATRIREIQETETRAAAQASGDALAGDLPNGESSIGVAPDGGWSDDIEPDLDEDDDDLPDVSGNGRLLS